MKQRTVLPRPRGNLEIVFKIMYFSQFKYTGAYTRLDDKMRSKTSHYHDEEVL